jgi:hypothetical protein
VETNGPVPRNGQWPNYLGLWLEKGCFASDDDDDGGGGGGGGGGN